MPYGLKPFMGSSNIKAMVYDGDTRLLTVRFPSGATYQYKEVPAEVYDDLTAAHGDPDSSLGKVFHALVIKGGFEYEKLP